MTLPALDFDEKACLEAARKAVAATRPDVQVVGGLMDRDGLRVWLDPGGQAEGMVSLYASLSWVNAFIRWNPTKHSPLPPAELGIFLAGVLVAELSRVEEAKA